MKKLIIMNGRWGYGNGQTIYIGAYSVADACRICAAITNTEPSRWRNEINVYFSKGCWGRHMDGITPERGAWITSDHGNDKPVRVL
jgi:hypothetical protein